MSVGLAFALCSFGMSAFSFFSNSRKDFTQAETFSSLANTQAFSPCKDGGLLAIEAQITLDNQARVQCTDSAHLCCLFEVAPAIHLVCAAAACIHYGSHCAILQIRANVIPGLTCCNHEKTVLDYIEVCTLLRQTAPEFLKLGHLQG